MNGALDDLFTRHFDLTADCGGTVSVPCWAKDKVRLGMGGDLSMSICMHHAEARAFGEALIAAADTASSA